LVNDHDPSAHSDRRHRCVILYIYIVRAVCCASHRRLPYIIYTVHCTLLYIYIFFGVSSESRGTNILFDIVHGTFSSGTEKKEMGFLYILPLLAHILWSREITVNVCIYLLPTPEHRFIKYVNTQARLLCKYVIGVIHIFKSVRFEIGTWWDRLTHSHPAARTSLYHIKYFYTLFLELRGVPSSARMMSDTDV